MALPLHENPPAGPVPQPILPLAQPAPPISDARLIEIRDLAVDILATAAFAAVPALFLVSWQAAVGALGGVLLISLANDKYYRLEQAKNLGMAIGLGILTLAWGSHMVALRYFNPWSLLFPVWGLGYAAFWVQCRRQQQLIEDCQQRLQVLMVVNPAGLGRADVQAHERRIQNEPLAIPTRQLTQFQSLLDALLQGQDPQDDAALPDLLNQFLVPVQPPRILNNVAVRYRDYQKDLFTRATTRILTAGDQWQNLTVEQRNEITTAISHMHQNIEFHLPTRVALMIELEDNRTLLTPQNAVSAGLSTRLGDLVQLRAAFAAASQDIDGHPLSEDDPAYVSLLGLCSKKSILPSTPIPDHLKPLFTLIDSLSTSGWRGGYYLTDLRDIYIHAKDAAIAGYLQDHPNAYPGLE